MGLFFSSSSSSLFCDEELVGGREPLSAADGGLNIEVLARLWKGKRVADGGKRYYITWTIDTATASVDV